MAVWKPVAVVLEQPFHSCLNLDGGPVALQDVCVCVPTAGATVDGTSSAVPSTRDGRDGADHVLVVHGLLKGVAGKFSGQRLHGQQDLSAIVRLCIQRLRQETTPKLIELSPRGRRATSNRSYSSSLPLCDGSRSSSHSAMIRSASAISMGSNSGFVDRSCGREPPRYSFTT